MIGNRLAPGMGQMRGRGGPGRVAQRRGMRQRGGFAGRGGAFGRGAGRGVGARGMELDFELGLIKSVY